MARLRENLAAAVRQGRFDRPPIGPVGALLSLTEERWAVAVEVAIAGHWYSGFNGYLVHSHRDVTTLRVRQVTVRR